MIGYNQCYDFKMASSFEWRPQNWRSTNPCWAFRREVARNDLVSPLIKTSNDSNQPKRKEKVWPDLLLSQYCVWYLPKGTRNGELIDVDSMRKKSKLSMSSFTQTWNLKPKIYNCWCPNFFVPVFITELVKPLL